MQIFIQVYRRKKFTAAKSLPPQKVYRPKKFTPQKIYRHKKFTAAKSLPPQKCTTGRNMQHRFSACSIYCM
jgi:hypothetical protein